MTYWMLSDYHYSFTGEEIKLMTKYRDKKHFQQEDKPMIIGEDQIRQQEKRRKEFICQISRFKRGECQLLL
jgi:hypothetical protein